MCIALSHVSFHSPMQVMMSAVWKDLSYVSFHSPMKVSCVGDACIILSHVSCHSPM